MNALTPLEQRLALEARLVAAEARIAGLEKCLRGHGLMKHPRLAQHEPGWIERFLESKSTGDGAYIVRRAVHEVARQTGLPARLIMSPTRIKEAATARQEAMCRAHDAGCSYAQIGRHMRRDHTTIMHGVRVARKRREAAQ